MKRPERRTLMQMQVSLPKKIALTVGIMAALILFVYFCNIPNPNMILIAGLVLCSALFGFGGGIIASVIMLGYTLFFFSTDHSITQFTPENMQKVIVSLIGITADMLLVCYLKTAELQAFGEVKMLTKALHLENERLQEMSLTDALTGIQNRMALRFVYDSYQGHEVVVMMLDLNNFKHINDTSGHEEGDRILRETGQLLADAFGQKNCYRYGGDEFLVIVPDITEPEFREQLDAMLQRKAQIGSNAVSTDFAIGYVHVKLQNSDMLRDAIAAADERMYQNKRDRKHPASPHSVGEQPIKPIQAMKPMKPTEYTIAGMKAFLQEASGKYDLVRVVDPIECRILDLHEDGRVSMTESCYGIWNAEQKCINCSSAAACRTGCHQEKAEQFQDNVYFIQSDPVKLKLSDGSIFDAVVELVNVEKESGQNANPREEENVGTRAAHYFASHDSLTNVLNADAFYEMSRDRIISSPHTSWVLMTGNIMNFRLINTLFGVIKGNEVLVKTASMLREISEDSSGLCGRLGGDQFALLIPQTSYREETLLHIAQTLEQEFESGIYTFCIHFGVYKIDDPSLPVSVMCGRANSALHMIREDLTHTVAYFDDAIMEKMLLEQKVLCSFDEALQSGQFKMYLQPLVDGKGSTFSAEALARWCKPDGTMIMPGDFIETLENAGRIQDLDMYIWEQAVQQLSRWKGTKREHLTISVNMSAKDFYSIDVYEVLTRLTAKYGVENCKLRLEITETALLVEPEKSDEVVSRLRKAGFIVEIDDFGKGFSSLSLLKNIQADVLKIDMFFLHEINDKARSRTILQSIIRMADALGMEVISEGVETKQQHDTLMQMGCSNFQGYFFSRPIPVEEFETRFDAVG